MKLSDGFLLIFILQALAILLDEFYFHRRRGLPVWERIGHPLDTLSILLCYACAVSLPPTPASRGLYLGLSIFSCVLVTKDEFVHKKYCTGAENWLHAVLFVLHPVVLILAGLIWQESSPLLKTALLIQMLLTGVFFMYQILYWNFLCKTDPV